MAAAMFAQKIEKRRSKLNRKQGTVRRFDERRHSLATIDGRAGQQRSMREAVRIVRSMTQEQRAVLREQPLSLQ